MGQIDLRDGRNETEPVLVRPSVAVYEQWLRDVLVDDDAQAHLQLLDTFVGLCELNVVPDIGGSIRADAWRQVLAVLHGLGEPSAYVGAFKVRLDDAVRAGDPLIGADRRVLARLLLERTAVDAVTKRNFRIGVAVAHAVDPSVLAPNQVVDAVLRPFVRSAWVPSASALVPTALVTTLAAVATGAGDALSESDGVALRAAIDLLDEDDHSALAPHVDRVAGNDRALIKRLIEPERTVRWWSRGRTLVGR